jgi:hypothetical protein
VAPKKRTDVLLQECQPTALGRRIQDEVEKVIEKDLYSSQRKRPMKAYPYATAAKFVDFAELFKSPKASEVVATHTGILSVRQSKS